ncbi:MAG TPA: hypothetical protein VKX40_01045 [Aequorivita sp.]|nr:hypothetical protein [Aequorivita sp.]
MSGGAGHIFSMIASLKHNKRNRKNIFDKDVNGRNEAYGKIEDYKKLSTEEFAEFQQKLEEDERKRQISTVLIFVSVMIVITAITLFFLFFY